MDRGGQWAGFGKHCLECPILAGRSKKFRETQGMNIQKAHPTHWKRTLSKGEIKKRSRGSHMQGGHFLEKIPEGRNCAWTGLDLVNEQKGFFGYDFLAGENFKFSADSSRIQIFIKYPSPTRIALQVDGHKAIKAGFSKIDGGIGLANLPRPSQDDRFPAP